jgi:hypothetical protein
VGFKVALVPVQIHGDPASPAWSSHIQFVHFTIVDFEAGIRRAEVRGQPDTRILWSKRTTCTASHSPPLTMVGDAVNSHRKTIPQPQQVPEGRRFLGMLCGAQGNVP